MNSLDLIIQGYFIYPIECIINSAGDVERSQSFDRLSLEAFMSQDFIFGWNAVSGNPCDIVCML